MLLNTINLKDEHGNNLTSFDTPGEFLEKILKPCIDSDLEKFEAASGYFSTASFISLGSNLDSFFNKRAKQLNPKHLEAPLLRLDLFPERTRGP